MACFQKRIRQSDFLLERNTLTYASGLTRKIAGRYKAQSLAFRAKITRKKVKNGHLKANIGPKWAVYRLDIGLLGTFFSQKGPKTTKKLKWENLQF
jgi:hypothetical protein